MPKLVCRSCGQGVYTTAPFEQLFADERRCPRCGQMLFSDRRAGGMRRRAQRRRPELTDLPATASAAAAHTNGAHVDGSPVNGAEASESDAVEDAPDATATEGLNGHPNRRTADRRHVRRRRDDQNPFQRASEEAGWVD